MRSLCPTLYMRFKFENTARTSDHFVLSDKETAAIASSELEDLWHCNC